MPRTRKSAAPPTSSSQAQPETQKTAPAADGTPWDMDDPRERFRPFSPRVVSGPLHDAGILIEALQFGLIKGTNMVLGELLNATREIEQRHTRERQKRGDEQRGYEEWQRRAQRLPIQNGPPAGSAEPPTSPSTGS